MAPFVRELNIESSSDQITLAWTISDENPEQVNCSKIIAQLQSRTPIEVCSNADKSGDEICSCQG